MVLQRSMRPSIARANGQLDPWCSQQTHHRPNQPHQHSPDGATPTDRGSSHLIAAYYSIIDPEKIKG